ncbi:MAG: TenA family transcriptional regulator [Sphingomonadales bacterium]
MTFETIFAAAAQTSARCLEERFKSRLEQAQAMQAALKAMGCDLQVGVLAESDPRLSETAKMFFKDLWLELSEHQGVTHPFLDRFATGPLSLEAVRSFGKHYYHHARMFLHYLAYIVPGMPTEESQLILMENLVDEYGSFDPSWVHPAVYRSFLIALGLQPQDWQETEALPEVKLYIDRHMNLCRYGDPVMACGALGLGTEWFVPLIFSKIIAGLEGAGTLTDDGLTYWKAHVTLDVLHSYEAMRALAPFTTEVEERAKIREGALRSLDARKVLWDGMARVTFEQN